MMVGGNHDVPIMGHHDTLRFKVKAIYFVTNAICGILSLLTHVRKFRGQVIDTDVPQTTKILPIQRHFGPIIAGVSYVVLALYVSLIAVCGVGWESYGLRH
jgi:hypothetical protein